METPQATSTINKIEFILVNIVFGFALFSLLKLMANHDNYYIDNYNEFKNIHAPFSIISNYFFPNFFKYTLLYGSYLLLNFVVVKTIINKTAVGWAITLAIILLIINALASGIADTWLKAYLLYGNDVDAGSVYANLFAKGFINTFYLFAGYGCYNVVKYNPPAIIGNIKNPQGLSYTAKVLRDCFVAAICWFIILLILNVGRFPDEAIVIWIFVVSVSVILYGYASLSLIPYVKEKRKSFIYYFGRVILLLALGLFFLALLTILIFHNGNSVSMILFINIIVQLALITPVTWYVYEYRNKRNKELSGLKTALGQSSANLDFLRSQINPHFLFNSLNTLYGTALQENADRTGEGIQKLGDMMRFMLQENMQEQISLMREVDYLNNYIDLQKLRTQISPDILITTEIEEQINGLQIAPMLLIPFVENAFKHGISLREPSHIKITLQTRGNELYFDVYNSIHFKTDNDPEKNKSGIGLENVKRRLELLYPDKHELTIRQNAREFFIHLSVTL
ncbi:MAG: histidine kinase [Mucilaginibacter sp.]|nr:histidine kinase [Mucilaginibacter sp.]